MVARRVSSPSGSPSLLRTGQHYLDRSFQPSTLVTLDPPDSKSCDGGHKFPEKLSIFPDKYPRAWLSGTKKLPRIPWDAGGRRARARAVCAGVECLLSTAPGLVSFYSFPCSVAVMSPLPFGGNKRKSRMDPTSQSHCLRFPYCSKVKGPDPIRQFFCTLLGTKLQ